jgi:hypothetical protein
MLVCEKTIHPRAWMRDSPEFVLRAVTKSSCPLHALPGEAHSQQVAENSALGFKEGEIKLRAESSP